MGNIGFNVVLPEQLGDADNTVEVDATELEGPGLRPGLEYSSLQVDRDRD